MASSLTITALSPYRALFDISLDAGTPISFQASAAVAPDKDLASLQMGPLRTYLARLANWVDLLVPPVGARVLFRRVTATQLVLLPISGGVSTIDATIIQGGLQKIAFNPTAGGTSMLLEMVFLHSASR